MAYTTCVAGTAITASWANANVRDQGVSVFASTAARDAAITSPLAGMLCFVTADGLYYSYSGSVWVGQVQGARLASATVSADQTGITALADLTNFFVIFTAVAGRRYRLDYCFPATQVTSPAEQLFKLYEGAGDMGFIDRTNPVAAAQQRMITGWKEITGLSAGSHTLNLKGQTTAGTMTIPASTLVNGRLMITDVGV